MSSPFDALAGCAVATIQSIYGSGAVFTYSRPLSNRPNALPPLDPFPLSAALDSGGGYATPDGALAAGLLVRNSDIPSGPQKGDRVVIAHSPAKPIDGTYLIQELAMSDKQLGWSNLGLRLVAQ